MKSPCAVSLHNGVHCISIAYLNTTRWIHLLVSKDPKSQTTVESHPSQNEGWGTRQEFPFGESVGLASEAGAARQLGLCHSLILAYYFLPMAPTGRWQLFKSTCPAGRSMLAHNTTT
jgi:hypothetical protein